MIRTTTKTLLAALAAALLAAGAVTAVAAATADAATTYHTVKTIGAKGYGVTSAYRTVNQPTAMRIRLTATKPGTTATAVVSCARDWTFRAWSRTFHARAGRTLSFVLPQLAPSDSCDVAWAISTSGGRGTATLQAR